MASICSASQKTQPLSLKREYYELRKYKIQAGDESSRFDDYLEKHLIPEYNDKGVGPVGVFSPFYGSSQHTLYVLIPYKNADMLLGFQEKILGIDEINKLEGYVSSINAPLYLNMNNSVLKAFSRMPSLKVPEIKNTNKNRIFELRTYLSPSKRACKKKIEMFNEGGEIPIMLRTGMRPVFFGETLVGEHIPNMTYMLAFKDILDLDRIWKQFWFDPEWKELREQSEYQNLVSDRQSLILRPKRYSQV